MHRMRTSVSHGPLVQAAREESDALRQRESERGQAEHHANKVSEEYRELQQTKGSAVAAFGGAKVEELLETIHRARGQFDKPPIGPLGTCLSLQDTTWATAVETALGGMLNCFLVSSARDKDALYQLCKQVRLSQHSGFHPHPQCTAMEKSANRNVKVGHGATENGP
jgi:chromosome segregation ATPase